MSTVANTGVCPFKDIEGTPPEQLWVTRNEALFGCFYYPKLQVHGLAAFNQFEAAVGFAQFLTLGEVYVTPVAVSFDEAREIAKSRGGAVEAVLVLDDEPEPSVYYVK